MVDFQARHVWLLEDSPIYGTWIGKRQASGQARRGNGLEGSMSRFHPRTVELILIVQIRCKKSWFLASKSDFSLNNQIWFKSDLRSTPCTVDSEPFCSLAKAFAHSNGKLWPLGAAIRTDLSNLWECPKRLNRLNLPRLSSDFRGIFLGCAMFDDSTWPIL